MAEGISEFIRRSYADQQKASVGAAQVVLGSVEDAPDETAGLITLGNDFAKTTGAPVPPLSMVKEYSGVFQQKVEEAKSRTILQSAPRLTEWLRDPANASLAKDDLESLSWFDGFGRGTSNTLERSGVRLGQIYNQAMLNQTAGRARDRDMTFGQILDSERQTIETPEGDAKTWVNLSDVVSATGRWIDARYADLIGTDDEAAARDYAGRLGATAERFKAIPKSEIATEFEQAAMQDGSTLGQTLQNFGSAFMSNPLGGLSWAFETMGESAPQLAAAVAAGAITRNPGVGVAVGTAGSYGTERYIAPAEFLAEKGIDLTNQADIGRLMADPTLLQEANERGVIRGAVISAFDAVSFGIAGRGIARNPVVEALAQSVQQAVSGSLGEYTARVAAGQDLDWNEIIAEGLAEMATTPVDLGIAGRRLSIDRRKAKQAEGTAAQLGEISSQSAASKLRARTPDKFREFVDAATANGPVENVFVPAGQFVEYFQGIGVDPFAIVDELDGVTRDDLDAAIAGGGDLQIPTATYAAKIAGSEHDAFLMENMRFDPNDFTALEAREFNERADDALQEAWELAEAVRLEREELTAIEDQIYDSMVSRLRVAGRSTDVATNEAMLYPAFYRVMAERSGMTTSEFLGKYPLPEIRGDLPQGLQLRDVDELNRTLAEARNRRAVGSEKRGASLLEFISDYGGINDPGGELRSRDASVIRRGKGKKTLKLERGGLSGKMGDLLGSVSGSGKKYGVDDVALAAIEAGYFADDPDVIAYRAATEGGGEVPDISRVLWDAIDRELRGEAQYAGEADAEAEAQAQTLDEIEEYLSSLGVSLEDDDTVIRQAIEGAQQYAQGPTGSEAFAEWFGDSKVVDGQGRPLVVYHGTNADIEAFDPSKLGEATGAASAKMGFFFASNPAVASSYADTFNGYRDTAIGRVLQTITGGRYERWNEALMNRFGKSAVEQGANVMPLYLRIENPAVVDFMGSEYREQSYADIIAQAKAGGHDGVILKNTYDEGFNEGGDAVTDVYVAFDPTQIKSVNNRGTFDRGDARLLFQSGDVRGVRGSILFPSSGVGNGDTIIRLFENADLSTMLHESGHYFLTVMREMASTGGEVATDFEAVKSWWRDNAQAVAKDAMRVMGDVKVTADDVIAALDNGTTGDLLKDAAVDVGMQEQFARGFEAYLMEGKAPNIELRTAFEKFRAWLISVYQKLAGLNVSLSGDIRRVFDRMIATDEEIAKAQQEAGGNAPVFLQAEDMGLTPEEYAGFMKLRAQAEEDAKAKLLRETMAPIKREQEKWFKDERVKVREEVEGEVNSARYFRAIEWMGNRRWLGEDQPSDMPDIRLSKKMLVDRYGEGVLKTLPRGKQTVYSVEGGIDPDDAAGWFGFDSGDELVRAMEKAPKRVEAIEAETDRVMRERHGDALNDGAIEAEALDAVHSDKRGQWIAAELKAVIEVSGSGTGMTAKEARASARSTVSRMRTRDAMNAGRFLAAERKAAGEAARLGAQLAREKLWTDAARRRIAGKARAAMRGEGSVDGAAQAIEDYNARFETKQTTFEVKGQTRTATKAGYNDLVANLIDAKRRQLLNHALYMEARKVADEVEGAERFVAKLNKKSTRERIGGAGRRENATFDYLGAIDDILERYDFRRLSGRAEVRRGSLTAFVDAMKAAGRENEIAIPDHVLADAARRPYKTLTVEELRGVVDSLKNLEHIATRWNKLIDAKNERLLEEAVTDIVGSFEANVKKRPPGRLNSTAEALRNTGRQFLDLVLNAGTILREIDGFADLGAAYRNIKSPIDEAMTRLIVRKEKAARDLEGLYAVYSKDDRRRMAVREHMPELGFALSKWEKLSVALNAGNEGNLQRMTDPRVRGSLNVSQVQAVLATLDERDADFVQSVWDYVGSFRDDIAAREKRATGIEPAWVEARPVEIGGKTLKGGYYPLKYDARLSALSRDDEAEDLAASLQAGRFGKAQTKNGHTKARAQSSGRAVELDMSVLHRHVNQVIYDLELSEPVSNSWRILQNGQVRTAFMDAGKQADFDALEIWLQDVGTGELRSGDIIGRGARALKSNFTAAKLAFNLSTVAVQITGLSQSMVVVGKKNMTVGIMKSAAHPAAAANEVAAKSAFMASRQTTFNKDIYDFYNDPKTGPIASRWGEIKSEIIGPLSFWLMTKVQWHLVDVPTWLAGYNQGLREFGNDEAKAVAHADAIVKRAQASGMFSDRSAIERGSINRSARQNDVVRLFTTLGSYMFAKFNVAYERSAGASREIQRQGVSLKSAQEALSWTLDMAFLFTLEAVVIAAIKGKLPDDEGDEDEDGWLEFLAKETAFSVMGTVPFVRDIASTLGGFEGGGAYGAITKEVAAPFVQAQQGEVDAALVKSVINATGLATGLPSTQINRAVDAGWRQAEGEDVSPLEYLLGRSGK